jgi:secreted PhoX family phosphatase
VLFAALPNAQAKLVFLTFDELPQPTDIDPSVEVENIRFTYEGGSFAVYNSLDTFAQGVDALNLDGPVLEGDTLGTLTIDFLGAVDEIEFAVALATLDPLVPALSVELFDTSFASLGSTFINNQLADSWDRILARPFLLHRRSIRAANGSHVRPRRRGFGPGLRHRQPQGPDGSRAQQPDSRGPGDTPSGRRSHAPALQTPVLDPHEMNPDLAHPTDCFHQPSHHGACIMTMKNDPRWVEDEIVARNERIELDAAASAGPGPETFDRRDFLRRSLGALATTSMVLSFGEFSKRLAYAGGPGPGYGELFPTIDQATGLLLLKLPEGFTYRSFGWTGDTLQGRALTPGAHDGMAAIPIGANQVVLIRNHELTPPSSGGGSAFRAPTYDPKANGGTTNLLFNLQTGKLERSWASLSGTVTNCAGGPTPWGSWLTCEERFASPGERGLTKTHGWILEIPAFGWARPVPHWDMGRFVHEAIAVDPETGIVYETEDATPSGLFRFIPNVPGNLAQGGKLEMLAVVGQPGIFLGEEQENNTIFDATWVPIADPRVNQGVSCYSQGAALGGAGFARLEGAWYGSGKIFINSTSGGPAGQVWEYDIAAETLRVVFQSPDNGVLDNPDNIAVSPRTGGLILCEDGELEGQRMQVLSTDGQIAPFAQNNIILNGERNGIVGDFRPFEWAGATFAQSSTGQLWLFANIQTPGITFAITGDWERGGL